MTSKILHSWILHILVFTTQSVHRKHIVAVPSGRLPDREATSGFSPTTKISFTHGWTLGCVFALGSTPSPRVVIRGDASLHQPHDHLGNVGGLHLSACRNVLLTTGDQVSCCRHVCFTRIMWTWLHFFNQQLLKYLMQHMFWGADVLPWQHSTCDCEFFGVYLCKNNLKAYFHPIKCYIPFYIMGKLL